jgi:CDP-diacylglycerol--serine O-phosphatidyltransferase
MIIAHQFARGGPLAEAFRWPVLVATLFLALLMVSTVRYRTFKDVKPNAKSIGTGLAVVGLGVAVAVLTHPAWVLVAYFGLYLISGLVEAPFIIARQLKVTKAGVIAVLLDTVDEDEGGDEEDVDDEEIL